VSKKKRIALLERRVAGLEGRLATVEVRGYVCTCQGGEGTYIPRTYIPRPDPYGVFIMPCGEGNTTTTWGGSGPITPTNGLAT